MKAFTLARGAMAATLALCGAAAGATDLLAAYALAAQHDPARRAADEAVLAGREKVVQGRALLRPRVTLSASAARFDERSSASLPPALDGLTTPDGGSTQHQLALHLSQPLIDARAHADSRQLAQQTELAEVHWRGAQQQLIERVAEAYFGVLLAEESLRVVRAEQAAVAMQRDRAQARFELGRGKLTDVQEAQARVDSVASREVSAQRTLAMRQAQYQELTGEPAADLAALRDDLAAQPPVPDDLGAWQARGQAHNLHVRSKQHELAIAVAEIDKHGLSGRPTLDLVASLGRQGRSGASSALAPDSSRSAMLGLQFKLPLYAGGGLDSRERESLARRRQADQELAAAQRDARLQVQDGFLAVKAGVARIAAQQQSLRSARTALEATVLGRDLGTRTELDVLDAQQRAYAAQLDLAQSRHEYLLAHVRLASATGELREDDLRSLNAQLAR